MEALTHAVACGDRGTCTFFLFLYALYSIGSSNFATVLLGGLAFVPQLFAKNDIRVYAYLNSYQIGLKYFPMIRKHQIKIQ